VSTVASLRSQAGDPATAPSARPAIRRVTLAAQIVAHVRDLVLTGALPAGSRIIEGELCAALGVSRTPLREALKTLAGEGLVDLFPARGAVVHAITRAQARDLLEVVTGLEGIAGRLACARAGDAEIDGLAALHAEMVRHYERRDRLAYYKANLDIHDGIVALSHNPELVGLHRQVSARLKLVRFTGSSHPEQWQAAVAEHAAMMQALSARDADRLGVLMREHMRLIWDRVQERI
jgi:DNA-binding GntR family transcriptional regulator